MGRRSLGAPHPVRIVGRVSADESWGGVRELPLTIESYDFERRSAQFSYGHERVTTLVHLRGGGEEGLGEDVSPYQAEDDTLHVIGPVFELTGSSTLERFCDRLREIDQWPVAPQWDGMRRFRNWAFESAALDLALRQAGVPLHDALGLRPRPGRFVTSPGLGPPPTFDPIAGRLEVHPGLRFKLDVTWQWSPELIDEVAATG